MNRLAGSRSPYLRQHADNPVDWYQWGDEAFAAARALDRLILLSVGYSSCHWCHVMAHESFEDPEVAATMNQLFVNVKVDREERPDVDAVYMTAVQLTTGHGGWPMTVFLTPDGKPVYAGTYFPKQDHAGHPGFVRVMEAVAHAWENDRETLVSQSDRVADAIEETMRVDEAAAGPLNVALLDDAVERVLAQLDRRFGGFGHAPKFPQAMTLDLLLRASVRRPDPALVDAVTLTLDAMAAGGMYDQVGGGFHRYSVDAYWLVPHFEKMLYDQALIARAYLHGWMVTGEARYRRIAEETITYVLRDLRHPRGGFFCAEDADSEGVEGKFYLWQHHEITEIAGADASAVVRYFGVTRDGNFVDPHTSYRGNILHVVNAPEDRPEAVARVLPRLFAVREGRVRPGLDDKILLAWNALFCRTLTEAAAAFGRRDWMEAARMNARFSFREMRRSDGRLLRIWPGEEPSTGPGSLACADDYAALACVLVTLAELDDVAWLDPARGTADDLIRLFEDAEGGGFFSTGADAESLIVRPKDTQDNATPSESSLACDALLRLARLTGERRYEDSARSWLERIAPLAGQHPAAFAYTLGAVERAVLPSVEVAICGDADDPATVALQAEVHSRFVPAGVTLTAPPGVGADRSPLLVGRNLVAGRPAAYVCQDYACRQPVTEPGALRAEIDAAIGGGEGRAASV